VQIEASEEEDYKGILDNMEAEREVLHVASGAAVKTLNLEAASRSAPETGVGTGQLFKRATPAQLLKGSATSKPDASSLKASASASKATKDPEKPIKSTNKDPPSENLVSVQKAAGDITSTELNKAVKAVEVVQTAVGHSTGTNGNRTGLGSPQQRTLVITPPKPEKRTAPKSTIHPDDVQIGRLNTIVEEDEDDLNSAFQGEPPRKPQSKPVEGSHIELDHVSIQVSGSDTDGTEEFRQSPEQTSFAGVGLPSVASKKHRDSDFSKKNEQSASTGSPPGPKEPIQGKLLEQQLVREQSKSNTTSVEVSLPVPGLSVHKTPEGPNSLLESSAKGTRQLQLIKLDTKEYNEKEMAKALALKKALALRNESLQERNATSKEEELKRQRAFDSMQQNFKSTEQNNSIDSLELESLLIKGMTDSGPGKSSRLPYDDNSETDQHGQEDSQTDAKSGSRSSFCWTDFARERAKALGEAVDEAEYTGADKAKFKLNPGVWDVLVWLRCIGWAQYEETFAINQIDHDELFILTDSDLQDMGMTIESNRSMLLNAIRTLKQVFKKERGEKKVTDTVYIAGRDKNERKNAELIAEQVNYEQKKGYLTWSDFSGKKWKRGYVVISGSSVNIFKSSDHVVLRPILTRQLQGALILSSSQALNCIHVQKFASKRSMDDIYLCAPDEEERDAWLQHLIAAGNLQVLEYLMTGKVKSGGCLQPLILILDEFHINNTGPYYLPHLELKLVNKNGTVIIQFDDEEFTNLVDNVVKPDKKGAITQPLSRQITLSKKLRQEAGPGAIFLIELKHTSREKSSKIEKATAALSSLSSSSSENLSEGIVVTQYWAYAFVDKLQSGQIQLGLTHRKSFILAYLTADDSLKLKSENPFRSHEETNGLRSRAPSERRTSEERCKWILWKSYWSRIKNEEDLTNLRPKNRQIFFRIDSACQGYEDRQR
jgi:hypothetical protein